ncbi:hypothetical protein QBC39DRAFT_333873 [Podospora conica]|nr:hypothetical protein QBC39DRAFT_333873 [Schizothecium conicum]
MDSSSTKIIANISLVELMFCKHAATNNKSMISFERTPEDLSLIRTTFGSLEIVQTSELNSGPTRKNDVTSLVATTIAIFFEAFITYYGTERVMSMYIVVDTDNVKSIEKFTQDIKYMHVHRSVDEEVLTFIMYEKKNETKINPYLVIDVYNFYDVFWCTPKANTFELLYSTISEVLLSLILTDATEVLKEIEIENTNITNGDIKDFVLEVEIDEEDLDAKE